MLNLLFIQFIVVFIIDLSGFVDTMKEKLSAFLTNKRIVKSDFRIRPFDCSLCTMFWTGLIYLIVTHQFTIPMIAFVCLLAITTTITKDIYYTIHDLICKVLNKIV